MEITIEIPDKKAPFVLKLLRNLKFLKIKRPKSENEMEGFRRQWNALSERLSQEEPDISQDEIMAEIRAVRTNRAANQNAE